MVINDMVWKNVPILIFLVLIRAGCDKEPDLEYSNSDAQVLGGNLLSSFMKNIIILLEGTLKHL